MHDESNIFKFQKVNKSEIGFILQKSYELNSKRKD